MSGATTWWRWKREVDIRAVAEVVAAVDEKLDIDEGYARRIGTPYLASVASCVMIVYPSSSAWAINSSTSGNQLFRRFRQVELAQ